MNQNMSLISDDDNDKVGGVKSNTKWRLPSDDDENTEKQAESSAQKPEREKTLDLPTVINRVNKKNDLRPHTSCVLCNQNFPSWKDFFNHLTTAESGINVFTCLRCSVGFLSVGGLRDHEKESHPTSKYVDATDTMIDIFANVIACADCGVHTVLLANPFGSVKSNYDVLKAHRSRKIRKISFYSWSHAAREYLPKCNVPKSLSIRIRFVPMVHSIPLKCNECSYEYSTYDQIETHAVMKHSSDCTYKSCVICSKSFATDFTYNMHTVHSHTSERWFLLEFLSHYPAESPLEPAACRISDRLFCDLCAKSVPIMEFNAHDCAVNYTRRLEVAGSRVKCPSVVLETCVLDKSSLESQLTVSVGKKFNKIAMVTLKYLSALDVDQIESMKTKEYWSCFCCESIFDRRNIFANHLSNVHRTGPLLNSSNRAGSMLSTESLEKYGDVVPVSPEGLRCPKDGCPATAFCSSAAVEWHIKTHHYDDFLNPANLLDASTSSLPQTPTLPPLSAPPSDPETPDQRKKQTDRNNVAIKNVFSLANGGNTSASVPTKSHASKSTSKSGNKPTAPSAPGGQIVLLHPPPVPNMKPGMYTFVVLDKAIQGHNMITDVKLGMFKSCEVGGCDYFVNCDQVEALMKVTNNGQTKFAVGCIPANYKLPEGVKIPQLAVVQPQQSANKTVATPPPPSSNQQNSVTATVEHVASLPLQQPSSQWECPICSLQSSNVTFLRSHLKEKHSYLCFKCGSCFVTTEHQKKHERLCGYTMPRNASFLCRPCNIPFSILKDYYFHLMDNHQADVSFDETNGQVYPSCTILQSATPVADVLSQLSARVGNEILIPYNVAATTIANDAPPRVPHTPETNENDEVTIIEEANRSVKRKADENVEDPVPKKVAFDDQPAGNGKKIDTSEETVPPTPESGFVDSPRVESGHYLQSSSTPDVTSSRCREGETNAETDLLEETASFETEEKPNESFLSNDSVIVDSNPSSQSTAQNDIGAATAVGSKLIDDEIEILSSDEDDETGAGGSSLANNRKTLPCNMCSRMFRTQRAVEEHMKSHVYDAGATSELSLPVPYNKDVFICRLCCLAYESYDTFKSHVKKHGVVLACSMCTAVSLAVDHLQTHLTAHKTSKLVFGCTVCHSAMRSEKNLLLHMSNEHKTTLVWNCQKCCRANTDWSVMSRHVALEHKNDLPNITNIVLPCAHCKLHYQPENPGEYKNPLALHNVPVGECPHRTFLAYSETLVGCPKCGSMIPATKYLLENEELRKQGQFKLFLVEDQVEKREELRHPAYFTSLQPPRYPTPVGVQQTPNNSNNIRAILNRPPMIVSRSVAPRSFGLPPYT